MFDFLKVYIDLQEVNIRFPSESLDFDSLHWTDLQ